MTTPAAARLYEAQHQLDCEGSKLAVWNPQGKPLDALPVIYGFNNGGSTEWLRAVAIAEDGTLLGEHVCSSEGYMPHDLGVLKGARVDRHEESYRPHYPGGYRMEFVGYKNARDHTGLKAAFARLARDKKD